MPVREFVVHISPKAAMEAIEAYVVGRSISGTLVDRYARHVGEHEVHVVVVLEKYYMRSSNRASHRSSWIIILKRFLWRVSFFC